MTSAAAAAAAATAGPLFLFFFIGLRSASTTREKSYDQKSSRSTDNRWWPADRVPTTTTELTCPFRFSSSSHAGGNSGSVPALRQGDQVDGGLPAMLPAARQSQNMVHEVPRLRNQELSGRFIPPLSLSLSLSLCISLFLFEEEKTHTHTHTPHRAPPPFRLSFWCLFDPSDQQ